ncbi:MAG: ankyrin repeat domain-containing protein [Acidovorax sp.]|nr:MAG: ankyrin repeat domain-containing protein [Acidovorax sp.]
MWLNRPKPVTRKQFEAAARKLDSLGEVHQMLAKEQYADVLNVVHPHGLDPNTVLYHRPFIVHLLTPQAGKASGVLPTEAIIALLDAGARPDPLAWVTLMPSYTLLMCINTIPESRLLAESITRHEGTDVALLLDLVLRSPPEAFPPRDAVWLDAANRCMRQFASAILDCPARMMELLLAVGLPAEPPADAPHSPLSAAIAAGSETKVALLLAHGANPNRIAHHGGNASHEALQQQGRTPLQLAVSKRNKAAQKLLGS